VTGEADIPEPGKEPPKVDVDKIKTAARKPLERELETLREEAGNWKQRYIRDKAENALTAGVAAIKVASPFGDAVKAMFRERVKIAEDDNGDPVAMIEGEYGDMPVDKYLKEWAQTDQGKAFIEADPNSGGGTRKPGTGGGRMKNPWSKDNWSPREQARIFREQGKEVAQRMAAEHGKKVM